MSLNKLKFYAWYKIRLIEGVLNVKLKTIKK